MHLTRHGADASQKFIEICEKLAHLDAVLPPSTCSEALSWVRQQVKDTKTYRNLNDAGIVVGDISLSLLPVWDAMWIAGLDEVSWPRLGRADPIIPSQLQRANALPGFDMDAELTHAIRLTDRWFTSTQATVLSFAERNDTAPRRLSPLLERRNLAVQPLCIPVTTEPTAIVTTELSSRLDDYGTVVASDSDVVGGAGLIADQAACPFRAFARYRLNVDDLAEPSPGLDGTIHGTLVHLVMQRIFSDLKKHKQPSMINELISDDEKLSSYVATHVEGVIATQKDSVRNGLEREMLAVERQKICDVAAEWLRVEGGRTPFEIDRLEHEMTVNLNTLNLSLKADRIDRLESNDLAVIDYKTGTVNSLDWSRPRLQSPQLPLYAISLDESVKSIAFAKLNRGESRLIERTDEELRSLRVEARKNNRDQLTWDERYKSWRTQLEGFADEYCAGFARVSPFADDSCDFCNFSPLCRIFERRLVDDDDG